MKAAPVSAERGQSACTSAPPSAWGAWRSDEAWSRHARIIVSTTYSGDLQVVRAVNARNARGTRAAMIVVNRGIIEL